MKKLLIPLVALIVGLVAGIGGGSALSSKDGSGGEEAATDDHGSEGHVDTPPEPAADAHSDAGHGDAGHGASPDSFYTLPGQFIIPIVGGENVQAVVLLSIGLETTPEGRGDVMRMEPRLRSAILAALFDLSSIGGMSGDFTAPDWRNRVSQAVKHAATAVAGNKVTAVDLLEINKQNL